MKAAWDYFRNNRRYWCLLGLVLLGAYGFAISHASIGIDDTCIEHYFVDGIAPAVGRWCLYLLSKVFHIAFFAPWFTELVAVVILGISVTLWCMLFYRVCGEKVHWIVYTIYACVFVSCPLISEVYVYYLHNGVCIAYGITAVALHGLLSLVETEGDKMQRIKCWIMMVLCMVISIGFYESFVMVFAIGAIQLFYLVRTVGHKDYQGKTYSHNVFGWGGSVLSAAVAMMVLRSAILKVLQLLFGFYIPENYNIEYRSLLGYAEMDIPELVMALKKFFVMYYLNAFAYFPITIFVIGAVIIGLYALIWKRDVWLTLASLAMVILPVVMVVIEMYPTHYRASQYIPLIGAFAVFLIGREIGTRKALPIISIVGVAAAFILIFNQCADMNKWFYVDYLKYEDAKRVLTQVAYDLEKEYDIGKPIVFRGAYEVPYGIAKDAYISYGSKEFQWIARITDLVDVHWKEKFYTPYGFKVAETPTNSTLQWGITAFDGTATQIGEFWKMLGIDQFLIEKDLDKIEAAEQYKNENNMPGYPEQGYIQELEDYIIVNLESE